MAIHKSPEEFLNYIRVHSSSLDNTPIITTSGGFDPLHVGHLRCLLESAKIAREKRGVFVVIANNDEFIRRKKGKYFMPEDERVEILHGIKGVDHVVLWGDETQNCNGAIELIRPAYFTKGGDRTSLNGVPEGPTCERVGCEIIFGVGGGKIQSSSWLIEESQRQIYDLPVVEDSHAPKPS